MHPTPTYSVITLICLLVLSTSSYVYAAQSTPFKEKPPSYVFNDSCRTLKLKGIRDSQTLTITAHTNYTVYRLFFPAIKFNQYEAVAMSWLTSDGTQKRKFYLPGNRFHDIFIPKGQSRDFEGILMRNKSTYELEKTYKSSAVRRNICLSIQELSVTP